MSADNYTEARRLIETAAQLIESGGRSKSTQATAFLAQAAEIGEFGQKKGSRVLWLHFLAVTALMRAYEGNFGRAKQNLSEVLTALSTVNEREQHVIYDHCLKTMMRLPDNQQIIRLIADARVELKKRRCDYIKVFEKSKMPGAPRTPRASLH